MNEPAPIPRRTFLGAAAAAAATASLALAAGGPPLRASAGPLGVRPLTDSPNASPDGTTIPSATSIIDNGGNTWTLSNGVVYRNGATVGNTYNVTVVLWYGGMVYHRGTGGQWYVCPNGVWLKVTDPRIPLSAPAGLMYGINTHHDTALSPTDIAAALGALGATMLRVNTGADAGTIADAAAIAQRVIAAGKTVLPVIDAGLQDQNHNLLFSSESQAYAAAKDVAVRVATAMAPLGVTMYECGNELTRDPYVVAADHTNDAGTKAVDWDNGTWPIMRGFMLGLIDGVKQVQPSALCGINFCRSDIGAADALWDGLQPDGSGGYTPVRWDITTWHNYEGDGDLFRIGTDGAGPSFNLPVYAKARYGTPFMVTEWNSDPNQTLAHRASYIPTQLDEFRTARTTVGLQSAMYYDLDEGTKWGVTEGDGTPLDPPYSAYQDYVFAHPDGVANPAPIGSTISLKASNGLYVSARKQDDGTAPLAAVATVVDSWERFTVVDAADGMIGLRAEANDGYVSAWLATAGSPLIAGVTVLDDWETFRWVPTGDGGVGLLSLAAGDFASAQENTAGVPVQASAPRLLGWETFQWATA
ncbi:fascin domain-containing protein [Leifsonia sp. SIMBA_070]|uniref:fascin domain-containing protein n=1 Tax=Leifsonia sp. SIMBA_070 TaxID=3085810 RepID=UPI00397BA261